MTRTLVGVCGSDEDGGECVGVTRTMVGVCGSDEDDGGSVWE